MPPQASILTIGHALENCNFSLFWSEVNAVTCLFMADANEFYANIHATLVR